jgi:replicative DNA helicase
MTSFVDVMDGSFAIAWAARQQLPTNAIPTPFESLNSICGDDGGAKGLAPGWFVSIGGGTSAGKSLLAEYMAFHAMAHGGARVGFLSLEMSHVQLAARFYAMATGTPIRQLERGRFSLAAFERVLGKIYDLQETSARIGHRVPGFYVNEEPLNSIADVMAACRYLRDEHGVDLFVLDYMQLVSTGDDDSIYNQVTEVASSLRLFAHAENVVIIALSQFNTATGRDTTQKPTIYGMMGGGTIPSNADIVLLLDHSRYQRVDPMLARSFILVAKNRHGVEGEVPIEYCYSTLRIRQAEPDIEHLWSDLGK